VRGCSCQAGCIRNSPRCARRRSPRREKTVTTHRGVTAGSLKGSCPARQRMLRSNGSRCCPSSSVHARLYAVPSELTDTIQHVIAMNAIQQHADVGRWRDPAVPAAPSGLRAITLPLVDQRVGVDDGRDLHSLAGNDWAARGGRRTPARGPSRPRSIQFGSSGSSPEREEVGGAARPAWLKPTKQRHLLCSPGPWRKTRRARKPPIVPGGPRFNWVTAAAVERATRRPRCGRAPGTAPQSRQSAKFHDGSGRGCQAPRPIRRRR